MQLIVPNWKSPEVPSVEEWLAKVRYVCLMYKLSLIRRYRAGDTSKVGKYRGQWLPFALYSQIRHTRSDIVALVVEFL